MLRFLRRLGNSKTSAKAQMKEERERISGKARSYLHFLRHKEGLAQYAVSKGDDVALLMVLGSGQPWGSYDGC